MTNKNSLAWRRILQAQGRPRTINEIRELGYATAREIRWLCDLAERGLRVAA